MISFNPDFKENAKNMFLCLSNFINTNILLYEHLNPTKYSNANILSSENAIITFLNLKLEEIVSKVEETYSNFYEELFAVLGEEASLSFPD